MCSHSSIRGLVIVPAYNESGSIEDVVRSLQRHVPDFDILVVDDGSRDDTVHRIPEGVTILSLPFNLGIGGAMQAGYRFAAEYDYDVAAQVDGDGQHPADELPKLLQTLQESDADLVCGSRFIVPGTYRQTVTRNIGRVILCSLLRVLTGLRLTDCTSGFRCVNRRVIRAFAHWYPDDYPEPEVVLLLHRAGYRIRETQVQMKQRGSGRTSIPLVRGVFYVVKVSTALVLDMVRQPWPAAKVGLS